VDFKREALFIGYFICYPVKTDIWTIEEGEQKDGLFRASRPLAAWQNTKVLIPFASL
jgi:hypothetical protein